jgi:beta-glucosidase
MRSRSLVMLLVLILSTGLHAAPRQSRRGASRPWMARTSSPERRAELAAARMTRAEKLTLVFGYFATDFAPRHYTAPPQVRAGSAGYIPGIPRLGIPPQWQTDAGIGVATQGAAPVKRERTALPSNIAIAATWDPALATRGGAMIGDEARRSGFNVMLAGGIDLAREPRNGRNFEYGGEDPLLAGVMVGAQIKGIQSNHIIATIKHYAINDQETDRDTGNSVIDPAAARMSDLLAFQIGIERGAPGAVMCSYNRVNAIHACENPFLLTEVLRRDWGFPGYVMSDWGATHSTVASVKAGLDQDSGFPFDNAPFYGAPLIAALDAGTVSDAELDGMVRHILRSMFAHGVVDHPVAESPIDLQTHALVSRTAAEAGAVLLRNEGNLLPLSATTRRIAVIGGRADKGVLAGGGSSLVYPRGGNAVPDLAPRTWPGPVMYYPSSPLREIQRLAPQAMVRFADGTDPAAAAALARDSDVAIVFATQWAGESFDVPLALANGQDALIAAVAAANPRTVVVLETGGPVLLPWAGQSAAILEAWYPGTEGGAAIANLLFGIANPSGHLPVTFPATLDQLPHPAAPNSGDTRYDEGAAVGYRWFEQHGHVPQFPFGHGLSYSRFALAGLRAQPNGPGIEARFSVRNTGSRAGATVAQVYVGPVAGGWEAPRRLGGWRKLALAPGEARTVTVQIDPRLLATFDTARNRWVIAPGRYRVFLGGSSADVAASTEIALGGAQLPAGWRFVPASDRASGRARAPGNRARH